jgi:hypothetical protein
MVKKLICAALPLLFIPMVQAQEATPPASGQEPLRPQIETEKAAQPVKLDTGKGKSVTALVDSVEPRGEKKQVSTLRMYKGKEDGVRTYSLRLAPGATWRVLWKLEVKDGREKASMSLNVRTPADPDYVQGIKKDIMKHEEAAFGVINICQAGAADFTIDVETRGAKWDVQVQQLK